MIKRDVCDDLKCAGELLGESWGDADQVCERREHCKRYLQFVLDHKLGADRVWHTGRACSDDSYEFCMPDGFELQIQQDGV